MKKYQRTCNEFIIVNIHASAVLLLLMVSSPKIHVSPSRGNKMIEDFKSDLSQVIKDSCF